MDFHKNLVCALILWRPGLGLLMGKVRQFLTELSARNTSVFYFKDNNLSKSQWIFTKFDMCIYVMEICFWDCSVANFVKYDRVICPLHDNCGVLSFHVLFPLCIALLRKVLFPEKFIILFFSSNTAFEKGRKKVFSIKYSPFEVYPVHFLTDIIYYGE